MLQILLMFSCLGIVQADDVSARRYYDELKKNRKSQAFDRKTLYKNTMGEDRRAEFESAKKRSAAANAALNSRLAAQTAKDAATPLTPEEKAEIEQLAKEEKLNPTRDDAPESPATGTAPQVVSPPRADFSSTPSSASSSGSPKGPAESGTVKEVIEFNPKPIKKK